MAGSPLKRARRAAEAAGGDASAVALEGRNPRKSATQVQVAAVAEAMGLRTAPLALSPAVGQGLTEMEQEFVRLVASGLSPTQAARHAGYADPKAQSQQLLKKGHLQGAIAAQRAQYEEAGQMTKKRVLDGFLEAIDQGKLLADPIAQIAGWREIAKLCGYYEPQKHEIAVSVSGNLVVQKLQQMSDADLLKLAEGELIEGEVLEREAE